MRPRVSSVSPALLTVSAERQYRVVVDRGMPTGASLSTVSVTLKRVPRWNGPPRATGWGGHRAVVES